MEVKKQIENAIKWIDGLYSTDLKQGVYQMGNEEEGFCCLGYGCHILDIDFKSSDTDSDELKEAVGLKSKIGRISGEFVGSKSSLVGLNDETNYTFKQISEVLMERANAIFIPEVAQGIVSYYSRKDVINLRELKRKQKELQKQLEDLTEDIKTTEEKVEKYHDWNVPQLYYNDSMIVFGVKESLDVEDAFEGYVVKHEEYPAGAYHNDWAKIVFAPLDIKKL